MRFSKLITNFIGENTGEGIHIKKKSAR